MKYMISAYGDNAGYSSNKIETIEEAERKLCKRVKKWCKENEIDIDETGYSEGDKYFEYGIEGREVCIYEIIEVPEFKDKFEKIMWEAKYELKLADYARYEYCFVLMDSWKISDYISSAQELIDKAIKLR